MVGSRFRTVDWYYQKNAAEFAVKYLSGVKGVTNSIIEGTVSAIEVRDKIEEALKTQRGYRCPPN
jgi:hypothetical protein